MAAYALWRRLDVPGHDAALLRASATGWQLRGTAVFRHQAGPACVDYAVDLDSSWRTLRGEMRGFLADRTFEHIIRRAPEGWYLDDRLVEGLAHLDDLDYGFTPATNLQQLRRTAPGNKQAIELPVAWFDLDAVTLIELPQHYERHSETSYWYRAPSVPYEALLELSPSGFVKSYPDLWEMEA